MNSNVVLFVVNDIINNIINDMLFMQGLFVPFACIGSGDPVRVLHLYTTNTLDTL